jgi:hypothetical protein
MNVPARHRWVLLALTALAWFACDSLQTQFGARGSSSNSDAGDAGPSSFDAGDPDSGAFDAGDAGLSPDTGFVDSGDVDGGPDAGPFQLRVELPCTVIIGEPFCTTVSGDVTDARHLPGSSDREYTYTVRVRGVTELKGYNIPDGPSGYCFGTVNAGDAANLFQLQVGSRATYYLNCWLPNGYFRACYGWDYTITFQAMGNETVTLLANSVDPAEIKNKSVDGGAPIVVPEVAPAPAPFNGQFIQVDLVSYE